ncbi:hypothetical protein, partial [Frankia sp. Cr1]|uniref:hypothetical protein n=1 Tax=Frankia sp. Cr1 TaxID=3073931 RepID=UPI002AD2268F
HDTDPEHRAQRTYTADHTGIMRFPGMTVRTDYALASGIDTGVAAIVDQTCPLADTAEGLRHAEHHTTYFAHRLPIDHQHPLPTSKPKRTVYCTYNFLYKNERVT